MRKYISFSIPEQDATSLEAALKGRSIYSFMIAAMREKIATEAATDRPEGASPSEQIKAALRAADEFFKKNETKPNA